MKRFAATVIGTDTQITLFRNELSMTDLLAVAAGLAEGSDGELTPQERALFQELPPASADLLSDFKERIQSGEDPLGDSFCKLLSPQQRRPLGATYTPQPIVEAMSEWAASVANPSRVHRGQVTGANTTWIEGQHTKQLPERVMFRSITRAKELFSANGARLDAPSFLKRVIDLPVDLSEFNDDEREAIDAFLIFAKDNGADAGFIARHRKA